ncbi:hypothetical protein PLESTB_000467200 [Pleodorina starrii]|uniref:1,3-beta-glucan synthase n=1 Tax=Pleodorina starrii TaxID=330485 RepID=A0A9W6BG36_9CHLO|nr:hypothetical protein PLESTB_000467200 [Pleodorina starrii]
MPNLGGQLAEEVDTPAERVERTPDPDHLSLPPPFASSGQPARQPAVTHDDAMAKMTEIAVAVAKRLRLEQLDSAETLSSLPPFRASNQGNSNSNVGLASPRPLSASKKQRHRHGNNSRPASGFSGLPNAIPSTSTTPTKRADSLTSSNIASPQNRSLSRSLSHTRSRPSRSPRAPTPEPAGLRRSSSTGRGGPLFRDGGGAPETDRRRREQRVDLGLQGNWDLPLPTHPKKRGSLAARPPSAREHPDSARSRGTATTASRPSPTASPSRLSRRTGVATSRNDRSDGPESLGCSWPPVGDGSSRDAAGSVVGRNASRSGSRSRMGSVGEVASPSRRTDSPRGSRSGRDGGSGGRTGRGRAEEATGSPELPPRARTSQEPSRPPPQQKRPPSASRRGRLQQQQEQRQEQQQQQQQQQQSPSTSPPPEIRQQRQQQQDSELQVEGSGTASEQEHQEEEEQQEQQHHEPPQDGGGGSEEAMWHKRPEQPPPPPCEDNAESSSKVHSQVQRRSASGGGIGLLARTSISDTTGSSGRTDRNCGSETAAAGTNPTEQVVPASSPDAASSAAAADASSGKQEPQQQQGRRQQSQGGSTARSEFPVRRPSSAAPDVGKKTDATAEHRAVEVAAKRRTRSPARQPSPQRRGDVAPSKASPAEPLAVEPEPVEQPQPSPGEAAATKAAAVPPPPPPRLPPKPPPLLPPPPLPLPTKPPISQPLPARPASPQPQPSLPLPSVAPPSLPLPLQSPPPSPLPSRPPSQSQLQPQPAAAPPMMVRQPQPVLESLEPRPPSPPSPPLPSYLPTPHAVLPPPQEPQAQSLQQQQPAVDPIQPPSALTSAALAARLQMLSRASRSSSLRDTAAATPQGGPPGGSPLALRPPSRHFTPRDDTGDTVPTPSFRAVSEAGNRPPQSQLQIQQVLVRPSGPSAQKAQQQQQQQQQLLPAAVHPEDDGGGGMYGSAYGPDGGGAAGASYDAVEGGGGGSGGGGGEDWRQYPWGAGPHPEMVAAAGGTLPLLYGTEWEEMTHEIVWRAARAFGFQAFNLNPETKSDPLPQWTPATAFLVSEHISRILIRNMLPRMRPPASAFYSAAAARLSGGGAAGAGGSANASVATASTPFSANSNNNYLRQDAAGAAAAAAGGGGAVLPTIDSKTSAAPPPDPILSPAAAAAAAEAAATAAGGPRFAMAVYELHNTIFHQYEQRWCPHLELRPRPRELQRLLETSRWADGSAVNGLLSELALYFLLYSEAANLRHTPELMWFLFWAAVHSPAMERLWRGGLPYVQGEARGAWGRRVLLRTHFQREIATLQAEVGAPPGTRTQPPPPPHHLPAAVPPDLAAASLPAFAAAVTEAVLSSAAAGGRLAATLSPGDADLLADLAAYGDGGFVTDRIVTPLFYFLSHEMDALFDEGVEVAHRLGYDDVNESMCRRDVIDKLLVELGVSDEALAFGEFLDVWRALTELGCPRPEQPSVSVQGHVPTGPPPPFDAQIAANYWSAEVFVKTFRERRSWAAVFRAFFRVYCLQLVIANLVMAAAFSSWDPGALSSAVVSHAWLSALERMANWWLTRNPKDPLLVRKQDKAKAEARAAAAAAAAAAAFGGGGGGRPSVSGRNDGDGAAAGGGSRLGRFLSSRARATADDEASAVLLTGGASAAASAAAAAAAGVEGQEAAPAAPAVETPHAARARRRLVAVEGQPLLGGLVGCLDWVLFASLVTALYVLYCQDPGGAGIRHELHLLLRRWWLPGAAAYGGTVLLVGLISTRTGYRVSILSWIPPLRAAVACHSSMPPAGCWMEGSLGVDWRAWAVNNLMWAVILGVKVAFEYFMLAKPMVTPIRALLFHDAPGCSSWPCRHVSWGLAGLRVLPLLLISLADTTIIYNAVMALFGILRGLLRLDLGTVASWEELRSAFHRGPVRWWRRCMSAEGVSSHRRALRRHLMEEGQDRAAAEAFVPETPQALTTGSDDEEEDGGGGAAAAGVAGGGGSDAATDDEYGDEYDGEYEWGYGSDSGARRGSSAAAGGGASAALRYSGGGGGGGLLGMGAFWPLRTAGVSRWARERRRRGLGRIRENGGVSAMAMMELQDAGESQVDENLQTTGRWATAPVWAPIATSTLMGAGRRRGGANGAGSRANGASAGGASADADGSGDGAAGPSWSRRRAPLRRLVQGPGVSRPGTAGGRGRSVRRYSDGGGGTVRAAAVAEGLEMAMAHGSGRDAGGSGGGSSGGGGGWLAGAGVGGLFRGIGASSGGGFGGSGGGSGGGAVRRARASGSDDEIERRVAGFVHSPVVRTPSKAPDASGLWQRPQRRPTDAGASGGGGRVSSSSGGGASPGGAAGGGGGGGPRGWSLFARHNAVVPLPPSTSPAQLSPLPEVAARPSPPESPSGSSAPWRGRRAATAGGAGTGEWLVTPRRLAFATATTATAGAPARAAPGPVAEATMTTASLPPSSPVGSVRLSRREIAAVVAAAASGAASPVVPREQPSSPSSTYSGSRRQHLFPGGGPSPDGGRLRDQDYWQRRQRQMQVAGSATATSPLPPPPRPAPASPRTTTLSRSEGPQYLTRTSLGSLSGMSADPAEGEAEPVAAGSREVPSVSAAGGAGQRLGDGALRRDPAAAAAGGGSGADTTDRDCVMALKRTEDLSLGVLLSRQNGDLAMWDAFATIWDGIVDDLRSADLISDREAGNLRFMRLGHFQGRHALRPILLPAFFYAGQVQAVVDTGRLGPGDGGSGGGATTTILTELRSLLMWLACELGIMSEVQAEVVLGMSFLHSTVDVDHTNCRTKLLTAGQALVRHLSELCSAATKEHQKQYEEATEQNRREREQRHLHHLHHHHQQQQQQQQRHQQDKLGLVWPAFLAEPLKAGPPLPTGKQHVLDLVTRTTPQKQPGQQQPGQQQQQQQQLMYQQQSGKGGGQEDSAATMRRLDRPPSHSQSQSQRRKEEARAATRALVAAHAGGVGGSLREVLEALAGEARATRRAVSSGRLAHEALAAAVKLEEVAQQVIFDLSAHPDFLTSCLTNLVPRPAPVPTSPDDEYDEYDNGDETDVDPDKFPDPGSPPASSPTTPEIGGVAPPPRGPLASGANNATAAPSRSGSRTSAPGSAARTPASPPRPPPSYSTTPPRIYQASGGDVPGSAGFPTQPRGAVGSPLRFRVASAAAAPSGSPAAAAAVESNAHMAATAASPRTPTPFRVRASVEFLAGGGRPGSVSAGSSWGSGSVSLAAAPPVEPEVALRVRVVEVLVKMLTTPASACRPAGQEAIRILGFFVNSLSNPGLKKPPPLSDMLSWSVLTPCYEEDVLYPLSADEAARQLGLPAPPPSGPGRPADLLSETEDNVSLMAYLRSVFPDDWKNFLERLSGFLGGADLARVTENDFAPLGPLHALAPELQLWATYRGQLLGRTVRGMMCYRRAVRMLVDLEYPRPAEVSPEAYNSWAEDLVDSKFQYVCTCQVYGKNRKATDIRRRWLSEGVDSLCLEFPALRVAYLDSAVTSYGPTEYSVLLRGNPNQPSATEAAARAVCVGAAAAAAGSAAPPPQREPPFPATEARPRPPTTHPHVLQLQRTPSAALQPLAPPARSSFASSRHCHPECADDDASTTTTTSTSTCTHLCCDGGGKAAEFDVDLLKGERSKDLSDSFRSVYAVCETKAYINPIYGSDSGGDGSDAASAAAAGGGTLKIREPSPPGGGGGVGAAATAAAAGGDHKPTTELYRVRLPYNRYGKRGIILGEGKPENQNHASIFCFGEALQTIDMNQDNALAEALKMRNLLGELQPEPAPRRLAAAAAHPRGSTSSEGHRQALAARTTMEVPVALVGFREWIFSDVSGALGTFAAACELAFGTIVQRTMSYPGRVRMHYGHPDVFNKMHIMTRGGLSKATRQLHISEDVFGGFNQLLRGGQIKYKEYISCGKGRDMGFDSINAFEIKISGGGGECVVSRDVARLAPRMDLARLMHFYHSGPGYYINSLFIMTAVWLNIWVVVVFALARASTVQTMGKDGELQLEDTLRVEHVLSLGPLMLLPYAAQLLLEWGLLRTVATLAVQIISGSVAFAVFRQQTTAYYFKDDITYGGARYISTGRGFSITSSAFTTLFTNYARSHLYPGMELLHLLVVYAAIRDCGSCSYVAVTWGTWLVAVALLFSPFWFNPMAFQRDKVSRDWAVFRGWMRGEVDSSTGNNWHTWNRRVGGGRPSAEVPAAALPTHPPRVPRSGEWGGRKGRGSGRAGDGGAVVVVGKQLEKVRNERGTVTDPWLNVLMRLGEEVLPRLILVVAAVSRLNLAINVGPRQLASPLVPFTVVTSAIWGVVLISWALQRHFAERGRGRAWRLYRVLMSAAVAAVLLSYSVFAVRFFRGSPLANLALLLYANSQLVLAVHRALEQLAPTSAAARALVDRGYWLIDWGVATLLLSFVTLLAWLGFVSRLQTRLLFNSNFAASIRRGKLVRSTGLMKLDEEARWRDEGQARAALAKSVAVSYRKHAAAGAHFAAQVAPAAGKQQQW